MKYLFLFLATSSLLISCIKDDILEDFVEPEIRLASTSSQIVIGEAYPIQAIFLDNIGSRKTAEFTYTSSDETIAEVDKTGLVIGKTEGEVEFEVSTLFEGSTVSNTIAITVVGSDSEDNDEEDNENNFAAFGTVATTTFYDLEGTFTISNNDDGIRIDFDSDYNADTGLPGLYLYLSNNPNSTNDALEIGRVTTFSGQHSYQIDNVSVSDYSHLLYFCKPFRVKVGDGQIEQ